MSKVDAMRALREARRNAAASTPAPPIQGDEGTCGHRSMNGRSCTRESGHAQKSHRYG